MQLYLVSDISVHFDGGRGLRVLVLVLVVLLVTGCASTASRPAKRPVGADPLISYALGLRGTSYVWGGESPYEGFDCSGFVQHVYGRYGVYLPRTARQMAESLPRVSDRNPRPGDLVFFNTTGAPYSHVGIYIGQDAFIHSSSAKGKVIVSSLLRPYWWEHFLGIRRPRPPRSG